MSNVYLKTFRIGTVDCLKLGNIEETSAVIAYLKGEEQYVVPKTVIRSLDDYEGIFYELSEAYSSYYLACINTFFEDNEKQIDVASPPNQMDTWWVPYNEDECYTFVVTDVPFNDLVNDNSLIADSFIKAFGVRFIKGEEPLPEEPLPPVDEWDGGRTFVTIRDNSTLEEIAKTYDLMNTRIYEEINNKYTLDFNILPYDNVWRIMHPNFLEINGDYFRVRRVEKKRTNKLMMAISCEHISYELNVPYELDAANEEIELPSEYPFEGTPTEILEEILEGSRFTIGTVQFNENVRFISKAMGARSLILGLANEIGAEVKWDKFTVSLLSRRGAIRDLTFEVGKNLLSMTEVYETQSNGSLVRSYDVDVIDLSLIENDGVQEELYDIRLGDTVFLVDEQFAIDVNRRVVSYEIDPYRKELPRIQLGRVGKNITNVINDYQPMEISPGGGGGVPENLILFVSNREIIHVADVASGKTDIAVTGGLKITNDTVAVSGININGFASEETTLMIYVLIDNVLAAHNFHQVMKTFEPSQIGMPGIPFSASFTFAKMNLTPGIKNVLILVGATSGTVTIPIHSASIYSKGRYINYDSSS